MAAFSAQAAPARCDFNRATLLNQSVKAFDQTGDGWRSLAHREGCERIAALVIEAFLKAHRDLGQSDREELNWHEGQLWAAAGDYRRAEPALVTSRNLLASADLIGRRFYEDATIAFVRHDLPALKLAQRELEELPEPSWFAGSSKAFEAKTRQPAPSWPLNHEVVDSLVACFDKPYKTAYSTDCR
jgi:hypothetical protein